MCNNIHIVCLAGPKALLFSYFRKIKEDRYMIKIIANSD